MNLLKYKKIIGILLSIMVLASLTVFPVTTNAAGDNLTLTANPATVASGSVVTFTLNMDVASAIAGWQTVITFDNTKFSYKAGSMTEGTALADYAAAHNGATQATQTPGSQTGNGTINISYAAVGMDAGTAGLTGQFVGATFQLTALNNVNTTGTVTLSSTQTKIFDAAGSLISGLVYTPSLDVTMTVPAPSITSFTPVSGGIGTVVTITGSNLNNNLTAVSFNGVNATSFNATSSTSVTATVPTGATTGLISLTTNGGTISSTQTFTVIPAPQISSFSPTSASYGQSVTISGTNLSNATVSFGGTAASITSNSATSIVAVVGSGTSGNVSVTTAGGNSTLSGFSYIPPGATVSIDNQTVTAGNSFSVNLNINSGTNMVRGWQSNISFDPLKLQAVRVYEGPFLASWATANGATTTSVGSVSINNVAGTITNINYALVGGTANGALYNGPSGTNALATITFIAKTGVTGAAAVNASNSLVFDTTGASFANIQTVPGTITVTAPATSSIFPVYAPGTDPLNVSGQVPVEGYLNQQLTLILPAPISNWNLVVTPNNNVQRTLNVFANTNWQVSVKDDNVVSSGYMAKYNGAYTTPVVKLANQLNIAADAGNGAGYAVNLTTASQNIATGTPAGQNTVNGGDLRNVMFTQPVTYTDTVLPVGYNYHVVVTFTASNTGF